MYGLIDGEFYDYVSDLRQFEESPCMATSDAWGLGTNFAYSTSAMDFVLEMPPDNCQHQTYTATLVPAAGYDYFATAGDIHEAILTTNKPYYSVTWYVKAPDDTSEKGTLVETDSGDTIQTEAWLNYTFPVGVAGEYTITAIVSWGLRVYTIELSYDVSVTLPQAGISAVDPDATPAPGDTYEVSLVTEVPYYYVDWYVKTPWDTSERGIHEEYDPGDGTLTEATFSYAFPSGVMHTGDFIITAVFYLWSSDPNEYEEHLL